MGVEYKLVDLDESTLSELAAAGWRVVEIVNTPRVLLERERSDQFGLTTKKATPKRKPLEYIDDIVRGNPVEDDDPAHAGLDDIFWEPPKRKRK